jgi:hypothetical protein
MKSLGELCGDAGDRSLPDLTLVELLENLLWAVMRCVRGIVVHMGIK